MFNVYGLAKYASSFAEGEEKLGEFATFEEAHKYATTSICEDLYHEGDKERIYWFSNENNPDTSYKCRIENKA